MKVLNQSWNLIYTKPRQENKVADQLVESQIEFLLPKSKVLRQWHDRKKIVDTPLFPSYIFVHIASPADYNNCHELDGFCRFVKFGNQLAVVNKKTIDDIDLIVNNGRNIEVSANQFHPGQKVVINQGPLCGLSCEVVEINKKEKVCVRVNLLNRVILSDMPSSQLSYPLVSSS